MSAALQPISMENTLWVSESHSTSVRSARVFLMAVNVPIMTSIENQPLIFWVSNSLRLEQPHSYFKIFYHMTKFYQKFRISFPKRLQEWRDDLRNEKSLQSWWNLRLS